MKIRLKVKVTFFRKNHQHKADFCHPGDPDYGVQLTAATSPKLCCPYGTSCYRVNPQHKLDFDHTQPPVSPPQSPTPRKAKLRKATNKKKGNIYLFIISKFVEIL